MRTDQNLAAAAAGTRAALQTRYSDRVHRFIRRLLGNDEDASGATQGVFRKPREEIPPLGSSPGLLRSSGRACRPDPVPIMGRCPTLGYFCDRLTHARPTRLRRCFKVTRPFIPHGNKSSGVRCAVADAVERSGLAVTKLIASLLLLVPNDGG